MEQDTEVYGGAQWVPDDIETAGGFTTGKIAEVLVEPGLDLAKQTAFVRHCLKAGYIHPYARKRGDARKPFLYRTDQVLIASVMCLMAEAGISDAECYSTASRVLNTWRNEDLGRTEEDIRNGTNPPPSRSPAMQGIKETLAGNDGWGFELGVARHIKTGKRGVTARVRNVYNSTGTNFDLPDDYLRRSVWAVDLTALLNARLFRDRTED